MMRGSISNGNLESNANLQNELELLLLQKQQQQQHNRNLLLERERDLNINRSGSAPPTVEGALRSAGNLFRNPNYAQFDDSGSSSNNSASLSALTEEDIRSHPAYLEYYYSNENLNPRLPPPLLSKEDWRVVQRFREAGGSLGSSGDWRNKNLVDSGGSSSPFLAQPGLYVKKAEDDLMELRKAALRNITRKNSSDLLDKGSTALAGASSPGMPARRKSFADIVQEGRGQPATTSLSRPASQTSLGDALDSMGVPNTRVADMQSKRESLEAMLSEKAFTGSSSTQNSIPSSFASSASSSLRGRGTELLGRSSSAGLFSIGNGPHLADNINYVKSDVPNGPSSGIFEIADIAASLSGLSMSNNQLRNEDILKSSILMGMNIGHPENQQQHYFDNSRAEMLVNNMNLADLAGNNEHLRSLNMSKSLMNERVSFPRRSASTNNLQSLRNPSDIAILEDLKIRSQGMSFAGVDISSQRHSGYNGNGKSSTMANNDIAAGTFLTGDGHNRKNSHQTGNQSPVMDPRQIQYNPGTSSEGRCLSNAYDAESLQALEKAYLEALLVQQKQQYQSYLLHKASGVNQYHANPAFGPSAAAYQGNQILNSLHSSSRNSMFPNEKSSQFSSTLGSINIEPSGALQSQSGNNNKGRCESLLEAVKNNKTKSLELLDVLNHVVEFSTDQYGSRFIQQKLETASVEEKMKIFREILPHARNLMIDVFGNYVIQKFIEHGTDSQRKELARHVIGHVLPLSLQMYGCRVIQKTLEVVDVEMQTQMVAELDGSVMKCVRDQNGNHVIQKCIECVPQDRIQFIVTSFFGQVVNLSTHPYGCRVIQRVLEHCVDPKTQQIIMDEIMGAVCNLARDQYGNYVIQHVLQHGKPHERSAIITKLAGQIVRMSQQKFASNVVEKCLTFGGPEERKILVNEMLGSTDENEPLQAMMKDPFGNYVVQKVLETCDDKSRQLIISRIKVHLHTLKKYTYGKHIVSRVEKLITTGERHSGQPSSSPA